LELPALLLTTFVAAESLEAKDDHPHLAQAWQALSSGDGLPNEVGLESYIYEDCNNKYSETCMKGHVFNYGEDTCVKYEVDAGNSKYTGTFYVKCKAVNCCKKAGHERPNPKKWDIGANGKTAIVTHFGANDIEDLDGAVPGADTWNEIFALPFPGVDIKVNYTYYISQSGDDIISHRIDYSAPGDTDVQNGQILYGNFVVKHADELDAFREVFKAPDECIKPNTLTCRSDDVEEWERKFFRGNLNAAVGTPAVV